MQNIKYKWVSEDGACEECKKLDGKIYEKTDDIPDKPHPNCRCQIVAELYGGVRSNSLEYEKLLGDVKSMNEDIDVVSNLLSDKLDELDRFLIELNTRKYEDQSAVEIMIREIKEEKQKLQEKEKHLKSLKEMAFELDSDLKGYIGDTLFKVGKKLVKAGFKSIADIQFFKERLASLNSILNVYQNGIFTKENLQYLKLVGTTTAGRRFGMDAGYLWNISRSFFNKESGYIEKNGRLIDSIDDLPDSKMKNLVRAKVKKQMDKSDSRGIIFRTDSSLAEKIVKSRAIINFVNKNYSKFQPDTFLNDDSLSFTSSLFHYDILDRYGEKKVTNKTEDISLLEKINDFDLFSSIHNCDIIDIYIDKNLTLHAKIIDTYDFNKNDKNAMVQAAERLQSKGEIETFFTVTNIEIPKSQWQKYIDGSK